jgi:GNAT superfamily N-acetyltransferase
MIYRHGNKEYKLVSAFQNNDSLRSSFNDLSKALFGLDFEPWYRDGFWGGSYIPYSLLLDDKIVSNVSASVMDFSVLGISKRFIQIGTVMTDPVFRGKGLSRNLFEHVIGEWRPKSELIFLYANDGVVNFYPRFGFEVAREYQHSKSVHSSAHEIRAQKLDMSDPGNRNLVIDKAAQSAAFSKVEIRNNISLIMFYCTKFMKDNVYYLPELDTIAIAESPGSGTLFLQAMYAPANVQIEQVIDALSTRSTNRAVLGFSPVDTGPFNVSVLEESDTTLFALGDSSFLSNGKVRFPIMSHT